MDTREQRPIAPLELGCAGSERSAQDRPVRFQGEKRALASASSIAQERASAVAVVGPTIVSRSRRSSTIASSRVHGREAREAGNRMPVDRGARMHGPDLGQTFGRNPECRRRQCHHRRAAGLAADPEAGQAVVALVSGSESRLRAARRAARRRRGDRDGPRRALARSRRGSSAPSSEAADGSVARRA